MGTNYYWHDRPCHHCGRHDQYHVGKATHTWRGYRTVLLDTDNPDFGTVVTSPFGFDVVTLDGWRRVFTERPGELVDEYDTRIPDPVAWLDEARPLDAEQRARSARWHREDIRRGAGWYDPAGFWFYDGEFC